jgi:sugar phosphate isomerase/epimerase
MSANYVARETGYAMTEGWMQGDRAANEHYRPIETFGERFDALLGRVAGAGFDTLDLWTAHLNWEWATDEHLAAARDLLDRHGLRVATLAGGFGASRDDLSAACRVATAVGTTVLGGSCELAATDRPAAVGVLNEHGVRLGLENHPEERTPADLRAKVGDSGDGMIGATIDTGWWGTHGYDAAQAVEELADQIVHVHLKDVFAPGGHETCLWGRGCVPVEECVRVLRRLDYDGAISVEHEPPDFDPTAECVEMAATLRRWLDE